MLGAWDHTLIEMLLVTLRFANVLLELPMGQLATSPTGGIITKKTIPFIWWITLYCQWARNIVYGVDGPSVFLAFGSWGGPSPWSLIRSLALGVNNAQRVIAKTHRR
jgi:hypothetical protein